MGDAREELEQLLADHCLRAIHYQVVCWCGWRQDYKPFADTDALFRSHLADALLSSGMVTFSEDLEQPLANDETYRAFDRDWAELADDAPMPWFRRRVGGESDGS